MKGIIEARRNKPFDALVAHLTSTTVNIPKHIVICSSRDNSMVNITDPEQVDRERRHVIEKLQVALEPSVQVNERARVPI